MAQEIVSHHKHNMLSLLYATCLKLLVFFFTMLTFQMLSTEFCENPSSGGCALPHRRMDMIRSIVTFELLSSRLLSKNLKIKIYRTIILPVILYGCGSWSLTLREERRLRVFENGVLRRIFGPKRDDIMG